MATTATQRRWTTWNQALRVATQPQMLRRTTVIALVVGTILSVINQAHVILGGQADNATSLRVIANYVVPFIVSNSGALAATKAPDPMTEEPTHEP